LVHGPYRRSGSYELLHASISPVIRADFLPPRQRDPFDRLLAAQPLDLNLPLISGRFFESHSMKRMWD
jgi:PIN domain nuclease of toxin-antitoxin system